MIEIVNLQSESTRMNAAVSDVIVISTLEEIYTGLPCANGTSSALW
jgi:hypothetical protein